MFLIRTSLVSKIAIIRTFS